MCASSCDAFSAHLSGVELGTNSSATALCLDYCSTYYTACKDVPQKGSPYLNKSETPVTLASVYPNEAAFCSAHGSSQEAYCYAGVPLTVVPPNVTAMPVDDLCVERISNLTNIIVTAVAPRVPGFLYAARHSSGEIFQLNYTTGDQVAVAGDLSALVTGSTTSERGFLDMAFHPKFNDGSGAFNKLYLMYSRTGDGATVVAVVNVTGPTFDTLDVASASEVIAIDFSNAAGNHNGGSLNFGALDGLLYISTGDGGGSNDNVAESGQDLSKMSGSIHRIDVDTVSAGSASAYSVPPTNPFVGVQGASPEIWAYGIRNTFRCRFDSAKPANLFCGDVGQGKWEEVNIISKGGNFGWVCLEGPDFRESQCTAEPTPSVLPIHAYDRTASGKYGSVRASVIGGVVVRSTLDPRLTGQYLFSDCEGYGPGLMLLSEVPEGSGIFNVTEPIEAKVCQTCGNPGGFTRLRPFRLWSYDYGHNDDVLMSHGEDGIFRLADPALCGISLPPTPVPTAMPTATPTKMPTMAPTPAPVVVQTCGNDIQEGTEECDGGVCCTLECTFRPVDTPCREAIAGQLCDVADVCSGESADCPDVKAAVGVVCRNATADCDVAEVCDGESGLCPFDAPSAAAGLPCTDDNACTADEVCNSYGTCTGLYTCLCSSDEDCNTDKLSCTVDRCVDQKCIKDVPLADVGTPCDDGISCTADDACTAEGLCVGVVPPCPGDCSGNGECCGGVCECDGLFGGEDCSTTSDTACVAGAIDCPCALGDACDPGLECERTVSNTGSVRTCRAGASLAQEGEIIPGVDSLYIYIGAGVLGFLFLVGVCVFLRRRRRDREAWQQWNAWSGDEPKQEATLAPIPFSTKSSELSVEWYGDNNTNTSSTFSNTSMGGATPTRPLPPSTMSPPAPGGRPGGPPRQPQRPPPMYDALPKEGF
jgi:hypothetical protein